MGQNSTHEYHGPKGVIGGGGRLLGPSHLMRLLAWCLISEGMGRKTCSCFTGEDVRAWQLPVI